MSHKIRVILADDHRMFLEGLALTLQDHAHIEVVGKAEDGALALELIKRHTPDVAVLDISMPGMNGLEVARALQKTHPKVRVLILTMHKDTARLQEAAKAGIDGYVLKNHTGVELIKAIETLYQGHKYFPADVGAALFQGLGSPNEEKSTNQTLLTDRELEVIRLVEIGKSSKEIADHLCLSIHTVNTHRKNMLNKLDKKNINEVIHWAKENGLMD